MVPGLKFTLCKNKRLSFTVKRILKKRYTVIVTEKTVLKIAVGMTKAPKSPYFLLIIFLYFQRFLTCPKYHLLLCIVSSLKAAGPFVYAGASGQFSAWNPLYCILRPISKSSVILCSSYPPYLSKNHFL